VLIRPDNPYTQRVNKLVRRTPLVAFVVLGGGMLLAALLVPIFAPTTTVPWETIVVVEAILALLCWLLTFMMSRRSLNKLMARIGTHLSPETIAFENPYFGRVEMAWDDILELELNETKGSEGIFFRLNENSEAYQEFEPMWMRGKECEKFGGFHWRMTPDLYDRPPAEMYALIARYWQDQTAREELVEEVSPA